MKREGDRRKIERRAPKRGVTVRIGDKGDYVPKRIRYAKSAAPRPQEDLAMTFDQDEDEAAYLTGYKSGYLAGRKDTLSAAVSVEALRALPRYNFADPRDYQTQWTLRPVNIVPDPEGDWVGWSDLAALWPPQTGDGK